MDTTEEWRAVVGYEGYYEVSDHGRVRSIDRVVGQPGNTPKRLRGKILKPTPSSGKHLHLCVCLYRNSPERKGETMRVHSLVAAAFIGPRPDGLQVCHNNGDGHDNRASNLRYDTPLANTHDRKLHGTYWPTSWATHCKRGHEYTPENTISRNNSKGPRLITRSCRTCDTEGKRARRLRLKEEAQGV
jgi:hypothetical protein